MGWRYDITDNWKTKIQCNESNIDINTPSLKFMNDIKINSQNGTRISIGKRAQEDQYAYNYLNNIAIGHEAGKSGQSTDSIAIGQRAGEIDQSLNSICIGLEAGKESQQASCIAIGERAGRMYQQNNSIAIGFEAGRNDQSNNCIAIGYNSAYSYQGNHSIAVGHEAGKDNMGINSVAIGHDSGKDHLGENSIAIGYLAGETNENDYDNTIILNATGAALNSSSAGGLFINPIREVSNDRVLQYNVTNKEITYSDTVTAGSITSGSIMPNVGNFDLGSTTLRWNNVYSTSLNVAGTISTMYIKSPENQTASNPQAAAQLRLESGNNVGGGNSEILIQPYGISYHANYQNFLNGTGANSCQVRINGVLEFSSDDRLKHNEVDVSNALVIVRQLVAKKYKKTAEPKDANFNGELTEDYIVQTGFIAQEVMKIPDLSYCVSAGKTGLGKDIYYLNYSDIFVVNVEATKELDAIVQAQQSKIDSLEAENTLMKSKLNEILTEMGKETILD